MVGPEDTDTLRLEQEYRARESDQGREGGRWVGRRGQRGRESAQNAFAKILFCVHDICRFTMCRSSAANLAAVARARRLAGVSLGCSRPPCPRRGTPGSVRCFGTAKASVKASVSSCSGELSRRAPLRSTRVPRRHGTHQQLPCVAKKQTARTVTGLTSAPVVGATDRSRAPHRFGISL